jgi:hypothetical protein
MARCSLTGLGLKLLSLNQPEAQETRDDQKDRYDIIKQLRHDQDEDAGKQRDDRLKVCDGYGAYGHFLIPCIGVFRSRQRARRPPSITVPLNIANMGRRRSGDQPRKSVSDRLLGRIHPARILGGMFGFEFRLRQCSTGVFKRHRDCHSALRRFSEMWQPM